jgi:biotin transporter BioY
MPYLSILMMVACAIFFHRATEFENESSLIWTGLSVVISVMTLFVLGWGWLGCLLGQAGLLLGITIFRILRKP